MLALDSAQQYNKGRELLSRTVPYGLHISGAPRARYIVLRKSLIGRDLT